jgi:hypothetical protein
MALPTQYARVALNFADTGGVRIQNILWYELVGTFGGGYNISTAALALQAHFNTSLLAWLSVDAVYNGLDLRINNNGVSADNSTYPGSLGNAAAGAVPNEVAAIVHWQTAQPGGSGRGRSYWTLFPAANVAGGRVGVTLLGLLNTFAGVVNTSFTDQGISWQLRLHSRLLNQMFPITSFTTDILLGTQRGRRPPR